MLPRYIHDYIAPVMLYGIRLSPPAEPPH